MGLGLLVNVFKNKPRDEVSVDLSWQSEWVRTGMKFVCTFMTICVARLKCLLKALERAYLTVEKEVFKTAENISCLCKTIQQNNE